MQGRSLRYGMVGLESAEAWRYHQKHVINICYYSGHTGGCRGKQAMLQLLHSLTVCVFVFAVDHGVP